MSQLRSAQACEIIGQVHTSKHNDSGGSFNMKVMLVLWLPARAGLKDRLLQKCLFREFRIEDIPKHFRLGKCGLRHVSKCDVLLIKTPSISKAQNAWPVPATCYYRNFFLKLLD